MTAEIAPALEASAQICGERLRATAQEMRAVLQATTTAASVNYRVAGAALFDARGRCVALDVADVHLLAAIRRAPRALIEAFSFDLEDGDVIASNHPDYHGVGPAVVTVVAPAFLAAQYVGAAAVQFRVGDLGGDLPGAWTLSATEALGEGLALPPLKVLRAGRPAFDAWDLLLLNSREPADLDWDLRAMIGACQVGQAALQRLIARVQPPRFAALCGAYLAYAARRARAMIGTTAGMRSAVIAEVVRLPERGEVTVRVAVRRDDRGCAVDLRACGRVVGPGSYLPRAATEGAVMFAVLRALPALPPLSDGALDVVTVVTDPGTVVDPPRDAATALGTATLWPAVLRATARALDEVGLRADEAVVAAGPRLQVFTPPPGSSVRLAGGQSLLPGALTMVEMPSVEKLERDRGLRIDYREQREDGRGIALRMTNAGPRARLCGIAGDGTLGYTGGAGAAYGLDGWGLYPPIMAGVILPSIEMTEIQYPCRILVHEVWPGSAGAGRWRGACGVRTDIKYLDPHSRTHVMVSGHRHRIRGFAGGHDGAPSQVTLRAGMSDEVVVDEVAFDVPMRDGDIIRFERGGGGGWGPPLERDGHRIAADLADGYITAEGARRDYGYGGGSDAL